MSLHEICNSCSIVFLCGNFALSEILDPTRLLHDVEEGVLCVDFFLTGSSGQRNRSIQCQSCGGQYLRSRLFLDSSFEMTFRSATFAPGVANYTALLLPGSALLAVRSEAHEHSATVVALSKLLVRYPCVGIHITAVLTNASLHRSFMYFSYFVSWAERDV